jgi:hypothetical protein
LQYSDFQSLSLKLVLMTVILPKRLGMQS